MFRLKSYFAKIKQTLKDLLRQGTSPSKLALALALGAAIGTFPIIGTNTIILIALCMIFRLNFVAPQITNYAVYPLQILMLIPFYKAGNFIFNFNLALDVDEMIHLFQNQWWQAIQQFGWTILAAVIGWAILIIPFFAICYFIFLTLLQKMHQAEKA